jgi:hypothetical protein|tara:strand:- start:1512 stop:1685 length:174 start_codon:yes stop_codon:yes gene_type:complete
MSWNNVIPAWMLGEFANLFQQMEDGDLSIQGFSLAIEDLPEVPEVVKEQWRKEAKGQ